MKFTGFPKIARLNREAVVTEKIDGTNAQVCITATQHSTPFVGDPYEDPFVIAWWATLDDSGHETTVYEMRVGSRRRWISPGKGTDNYGFAEWAKMNWESLIGLGEGQHFGEWYGHGIQRGYGLDHRRFALFNTGRWGDDTVRPRCCDVVPILKTGVMDKLNLSDVLSRLQRTGSVAVPGFMEPEGLVVFHSASGQLFKVTCRNDSTPKSVQKETVTHG